MKDLEQVKNILAQYVVLGKGRCTISKQHADLGLEALTILNAHIARLEGEGWQPIETAPRDRVVLISLMNSCNKQRTIKAMYFSKYRHEGHEDFSEYCEEKDEYFAPEGWYEDVYSETGMDCGYIFIGETPTQWQQLPEAPKAAIKTIKGE